MQSQQDPQALTLLIAGKRVSAADGATFERRNPLDGEIASCAPHGPHFRHGRTPARESAGRC